ncbi:MAG: acyl-CoA desaturase, partial [Gemmatimonadales bacterium]
MMVKTAAVLALTFVPYGLILTGWFPPLVMLALAAIVGVGMAGIGFAVGHDALHGAYSERPRVNQVVGWSMDVMGASSYLWK